MRTRHRLLALLLACAALVGTLLLARAWLAPPAAEPLDTPPTRAQPGTTPAPALEAPAAAGAAPGQLLGASRSAAHAARVAGEVVDRNGRPLGGVALALHAVELAARRGLSVEDGAVLALGRSEPDGSFDLPAPPAGHARLHARAPGLARASVLVDASGGQFTVVLVPQARLVVELVDAQGAAAGSVQGQLEVLQGPMLERVPLAGDRVVLEGLAPGPVQVRAWLEDGRAGLAGPVVLRAGEEAQLLLVLEAAAHVAGTVLEAGSDTPLAGASVVLAAPGRRVAAGTTDASGRFGPWPAGLPGEPVQVSVELAGYAAALEGLPALPAGGLPTEVELRLEAAAPWQGVVVDRAGQPVAGAEVAYTSDGIAGREPARTTSDAEGRFTLPPPPPPAPGRRIVLVAQHAGARAALPLRPAQPAPASLQLVLEPGLEVRGRVAGSDGAARAGVRVLVLPAFDAAPAGRTGEADPLMLAANALGEPLGSALSGADGTFALRGPPSGMWRLQAEVTGTSPAPGPAFTVDEALRLHGVLDAGTLVLDAEHVLEGEVCDARGAPCAGVVVTVRSEGAARPRAATTDAQGRFRLAGLPAGTGLLLLDGQPAGEVALPAAQPLRRVLPEAAHLRVRAREGEPALEGLVTLALRPAPGSAGPGSSAPRSASVRSVEGEARFTGLPLGRWELQVLCGAREARSELALEPAAGEGAPLLVLSFGPRAALEGTVLDAEGQPLPGAEVRVERLGEDGRLQPGGMRLRTDAQGRWRAQPGAPGRLRLRASAPAARGSDAPVEALVELGAGTQEAPRLQLAPGARLRVRVQDPEGRPLPGALVAVLPATEGSSLGAQQVRCNADGEAALANLPAGSVRVRVRAAGGLQAEARLELSARATLVTTLRLEPRAAPR